MTQDGKRELRVLDEPLIGFWQPVARNGYTWVESEPLLPDKGPPGPAPYLVPAKRGDGVRAYDPFTEEWSLFLTLADAEPSPEGIRAVANLYGLLGSGCTIAVRTPYQPGAPAMWFGESLGVWQEQLRRLRVAVGIWQMVRHGDEAGLAQHLQWRDGRKVEYDTDPDAHLDRGEPKEVGILGVDGASALVMEALTPGDLLGPALLLVQRLVNAELEPHTVARLQWDVRLGKPRLHLVPDGLLGAIWLQFAQAIHGEKEYRVCPQCGTWFERRPESWHRRSDRHYCSDACRWKAYRARKAGHQ